MTANGSRMQLNFSSYRANAAKQQNWSDNSVKRCDQSEKRDRECSRRCVDLIDERSEDFALFAWLFKDKHENSLDVKDQVQNIGEQRDVTDHESTIRQRWSKKWFYARHFNELFSLFTQKNISQNNSNSVEKLIIKLQKRYACSRPKILLRIEHRMKLFRFALQHENLSKPNTQLNLAFWNF